MNDGVANVNTPPTVPVVTEDPIVPPAPVEPIDAPEPEPVIPVVDAPVTEVIINE